MCPSLETTQDFQEDKIMTLKHEVIIFFFAYIDIMYQWELILS